MLRIRTLAPSGVEPDTYDETASHSPSMSAGGVSVTSRTGTAEAAAGGQLDDVKMSKMGMSQAMDDSELDEPVRARARD